MRDLAKSTAAAVVLAGLIVVGYVVWWFDWDCCPHESDVAGTVA